MISYCTSSVFLYRYRPDALTVDPLHLRWLETAWYDNRSYFPRLSRIGNASSKIFIYDGARWKNETQLGPPDYFLEWSGSGNSPGGHYADYGPWSDFTRSFQKNNNGMIYAMRHGRRDYKGGLGALRFNVAFFDGHVETLSAAQGMNPHLWLPKDTLAAFTEFNADAKALYRIPAGGWSEKQ
jgi:prepilin-type processing-associated H-X9-DG protein